MNGKVSQEVVLFRSNFQKLKNVFKGDPSGLEESALENESLKQLCLEFAQAAFSIEFSEQRHPQMFAKPVDRNFVLEWRDYEEHFASSIAGIFLRSLGLNLDGLTRSSKSKYEVLWENADETGQERARALDIAINYAVESVFGRKAEVPDRFEDSLVSAKVAWFTLRREIGLDLQSVFRRRALVPFVNIPTHVANRYGEQEKLSLFTHLRQAHDAFVLGTPFAAVALMRSVVEVVLRDHYRANGKELKEYIDSANLPSGLSRDKLHKLRFLANDVLHMNPEKAKLPKNLEKELLSMFEAVRDLIEKVPLKK